MIFHLILFYGPALFLYRINKFVKSVHVLSLPPVQLLATITRKILKCNKLGFPVDGVKSYFHVYNQDLPSIYDAFYDDGNLFVVMTLHSQHDFYKLSVNDKYSRVDWFCKVDPKKEAIKNVLNMRDREHRIKLLKFPIPQDDIAQSNGFVDIFNLEHPLNFSQVPFCVLPPPPPKDKKPFATLCTQQLFTPRKEMLDWLIWHLAQGFDHALIYYNDDHIEEMKQNLSEAIKLGYLTFIDWNWPKTSPFQDQKAQIISCVYRTKRRYSWVGFNDLDEAFFPYANGGTVLDSLNELQPARDEIGSLAFPNRLCNESDLLSSTILCDKDRDRFPAKQKVIVNPDNVEHMAVHSVHMGKPEVRSNKLFKAHFKNKTKLFQEKPGMILVNFTAPQLNDKINQFKVLFNYSI